MDAAYLRVLQLLHRESEETMKAVQTYGFGLTAALCILLSAGASRPLAAQATQSPPNAPNKTLPRLPDGRPDLQGLWLKSAGGFQGLFIGSLDGTNFAAPGGGRGDGRGGRGAGGGPPAPRYEYTPEAEAERLDRLKRGYED